MNPMEQYLNNSMSGGAPEDKSVSGPFVEDEKAESKTGKLSFAKPEGFKLPEGVKEGEPFDAMATLKMENGKLVLNELDGAPVSDEYGEEEETPEEESEETPEEETSEEEAGAEPESHDMEEDEESEPTTEEPEANDAGEPKDFLSAIESKAKKFKK